MLIKQIIFLLTITTILIPVAHANDIKIGAILHLTGDQAMQGEAFRHGLQLAVTHINQSGGCLGRKIDLTIEDSQLKPKEAHTAAKKLISVNKVIGVINASFLEVMANGQEFQQAKIPVVTLWDSSPAIEALGNYHFSIGVWTPSAGEKAATFAYTQLKARRAVIVSTQNEWSQSVANYFKNSFEKSGGIILDSISLPPESSDFRSVISRLRSINADLIYSPITDNVTAWYRQLNDAQLKLPIVTSDIITEAHISISPRSFENIYQTQTMDPMGPKAQSLSTLYEKQYKQKPPQLFLTALGYDGIELFCQAVKNSRQANTVSIRDALAQIRNYQGASGTISFNTRGSSPKSESMFQIKEGKFVAVSK